MKICIIGPTFPYRGGISHYTTLLYKHLKKKHSCILLSFKKQYPKWLYPGKTDIDQSLTTIVEKNTDYLLDPLNPITWVKTFIRIKKYNPALVIIHWWVFFWTPSFWTITKLMKFIYGKKILFICHNVEEHDSNLISKICTRLVLKNSDYYIVHSKTELDNLKKIIPLAKVKQTCHPIYEIFNTRKINKEEARKRLNIKGNIILFFGFIRRYKGLQHLINAIPIIQKKINVTLLIAGEFWADKQNYIDLINKNGILDQVKITDQYIKNEDVKYYFSAADIVVLPYITATGSGIVQTAVGFDKPVITTNVGNLPEIITNKKSGYIVPPGDHYAIARAIIDFYQKKKEQDFIDYLKNDKKRFSWDKLVETIVSFD
jgi:glycosyltransferase involved in cell wall biosynthesis